MNILIVKTSSLGDIIHAYPVLTFLKQHYPDAKIDWVVEKPFAALVEAHPHVNRVISVETKKWRKKPFSSWKDISRCCKELQAVSYDVAFDLQGNIKSGVILNRVHADCKVGLGWKTLPEKPNGLFTGIKFNPPQTLSVREENLFIVQNYFKNHTHLIDKPIQLKITSEEEKTLQKFVKNIKKPTVMVCPGSAWPNKQTSSEALVSLLKKLQASKHCSFVFVWGSEKEYQEVLSLAKHFPDNCLILEKVSLALLQNFMMHMDLVVAMDSLPLHLAGTTGVPIYGVFGPSSAAKYMPAGQNNRSCQGTCPYGRSFVRRCPILRTCPTGQCIKALTGEKLLKVLLE